MDVRIQNVSSRVRMADAGALLTPEVLSQLVAAVKQALAEEQALQLTRDDDKNINRNASRL